MIWASAPSVTDTPRLRTSPCAPAGASSRTSKIDASGALSVMGRNAPSFTCPPGSSVALMATKTPAPATARKSKPRPGLARIGSLEVGDDLVTGDRELDPGEDRIERDRRSGTRGSPRSSSHRRAARRCARAAGAPCDRGAGAARSATISLVRLGHQLAYARLGDLARTERCVEIALALLRHAHVRHQQRHHRAIHLPALVDLDRRHAHAFLIDVGGKPRVAARDHAADVHPMRPHGGEEDQLATHRRTRGPAA